MNSARTWPKSALKAACGCKGSRELYQAKINIQLDGSRAKMKQPTWKAQNRSNLTVARIQYIPFRNKIQTVVGASIPHSQE